LAFLDRIFRISEAPGDRFKSTNGRDWIALDGDLRAAACDFSRRGLLDFRLRAFFSNNPKHAFRYAPNVAIHWKCMDLHGL